jgi:magnesium transporter
MIRIFYLENKKLIWEKNPPDLESLMSREIIWVDLHSPVQAEKNLVEQSFEVKFQTAQEAAEIESSSRYFEEKNTIHANTSFILPEKSQYNLQTISLILRQKILFTTRTSDSRAFAETVRILKNIREESVKDGADILTILLETGIDLDADYIETVNRHINFLSRKLLKEKVYDNQMLLEITELQENAVILRESIMDKQRLVSSLIRSIFITEEDKVKLRVVIKDINSLVQHITFSFERLEYLQNTFLGLINIEQNQIIKIFTVASVIILPPTLIASIYGMNFKYMPELSWVTGYPFALALMLFSSLVTLWYFKKRKWL